MAPQRMHVSLTGHRNPSVTEHKPDNVLTNLRNLILEVLVGYLLGMNPRHGTGLVSKNRPPLQG